ncbi:hypothetical protein HU200_067701 [Digitaria exilis]|uniref:Uncharacterized protein n=1 Tax=Digitaria exilis TaxID=1010633 RepID=A0A834ZUI4_9POAL|nr:hypothetical protein HU200_067701 [Digitaria exilis]
MPSVLLVWIVCCSWAQLSAAAPPYGPNMTDSCFTSSSSTRTKTASSLSPSIKAFIAIGCSPAFAVSAATSTHSAFGPLTTPPGKIASTNIHVSHIHQAVHGSDSGAYDKKGNFVPNKFERIFQRFARSEKDALSWLEVETMLTANRELLKPWTWPAAETEWQLIHFLGKDRRGYLHKDTLRGIYDGTVFPKLRDNTIPRSGHSDA